MKIKQISVSICLLLVFLLIFGIFQENIKDNQIVASVNGEEILYKDVKNICQQFDGEGTPEIVLNSLIDELVVITNADKIGVSVTQEEINHLIKEYKETLPDIYKKGIKLYGKNDFYEGLKWQLLYDKVCDVVVEETLEKNEAETIEKFYIQIKMNEDVPVGLSQEDVLEDYYFELEEYIFDNWIEERRNIADIKVYTEMEEIK